MSKASGRVSGCWPGVTEFIEKRLKLKENKEKSAVKPATKAVALGFGFYHQPGGRIGIRVAPKALRRMRVRIRWLTGRSWRIAMPEPSQSPQPVHRGLVCLLCEGRDGHDLRKRRQLATPPSQTGQMGGMEAPPRKAAQLDRARD